MESLTVRSKRDIIDFVNSHSNPNRGTIMVYIALGGYSSMPTTSQA